MMKFKKFLAATMTGAMMFGVTAAAAPAKSVYAANAEGSEYTIEIVYDSYSAIISSETKTDPYVVLEVLKDSTGSSASATYVYEMNGKSSISVDLSFLKATKASYLRVHGSSETGTSEIVPVNAQPAKISLKYTSGQLDAEKSAAQNLVAAFSNSKTAIKEEDITNNIYYYRSLYGGFFVPLSEFDQAVAEIAGTTIVVRKAAVDNATDSKNNAPAGAEVKVKITAAPKAPKVTVDYATGSIKLPKKTEAQIVYSDEGTSTVPASMKLAEGKDTLYASSDGGSTFTEVTNENLDTFFEVADNGTVSVKAGCTFADAASSGNPVSDADAYVKGTEKTTVSSSGSKVTAWKDCATTAPTLEAILGWFDEIKSAQDLIKSGFTLVVRTKADKKAASNANILVIEGSAETIKTEGKDEVKVGDAALTWETVATGIKYTGTGFEYYDTSKSKWVTIKTGAIVKTTVNADVTIKVRKAGVKATKTTDGVLPSISTDITVKKYEDPDSASSSPTVELVTVTIGDGSGSVESDAGTVACKAVVTGSTGVAQTVTWTMVGEDSDGEAADVSSTIDSETGIITIDEGDEGITLVVTATSTVDTTKTGTAKVEVVEAVE